MPSTPSPFFDLLVCPSVFLSRSCVYRILLQQPTRSVFLHAGVSLPPVDSTQSRHGVRDLLSPGCQHDPQYSGQWGGRLTFKLLLLRAIWAGGTVSLERGCLR